MTVTDSKKLDRTAQFLVVEAKRGYGSPPSYDTSWLPVWGAKVARIDINGASTPSVVTVWFPELHWEQTFNLVWGDMIRIRTDEYNVAERTIVFEGFITRYLSDFSGGTDKPRSSFNRNAFVCQDYRWLLSITSPIFGQIARGPDDYKDYGKDNQQPVDNSYTWLNGQRAIFNANGKPNMDPTLLTVQDSTGNTLCQTPIFADPDIADPWTAKDMLRYVLSPLWNKAYQYLPIADPEQLSGLDHDDWDKVLNHIVIDGLNVIDATGLICKHLGWSFRQDIQNNGDVTFSFYKVGSASGYVRDSSNITILHQLHAPAVNETIKTAIGQGKKMLWSMSLAEDIAAVVNNPWGLGAPDRFEFTAEFVPAWLDSNLNPDTDNDNDDLFITEADLQESTDPDSKSYYKYYHPRGSSFLRDIGRKWSLNEAGRYSASGSGSYDRGMPFDFATVIPSEYIIGQDGNRLFAPFNRRLLPSLTLDKDDLNSVGIKVEFSFDGGQSWQVIPAAISNLKNECAIYIDEANLAELVDQAEGTISGGQLDGIQLNYWASLCDDKLEGRSFKDGQWKTKVRVTASVQLDLRLTAHSSPSSASGSPFHHSQVYDFSQNYGINKRTSSSTFDGTDLAPYETDDTEYFDKHLDAIRKANEDMSISGQFTLDRLWLGDGAGSPDFALGDCVERITGREYNLSAALGGGEVVYPEIIAIIYLPDKQKTKLITRDLRFAEVLS